MADYRQISVTETDGVTVVRFNDQRILDAGSIQQLGEDLFQLVESGQGDKLLLNFIDVEFLSSAALNRLIILDKKVKERSGTLKMCNICWKMECWENPWARGIYLVQWEQVYRRMEGSEKTWARSIHQA